MMTVISQVCVAELLKRVKRVNKAQGSDGVTNDHNYVLSCIYKYCILCILCVYLCNQIKKIVVKQQILTCTYFNRLCTVERATKERTDRQTDGQKTDKQRDSHSQVGTVGSH